MAQHSEAGSQVERQVQDSSQDESHSVPEAGPSSYSRPCPCQDEQQAEVGSHGSREVVKGVVSGRAQAEAGDSHKDSEGLSEADIYHSHRQGSRVAKVAEDNLSEAGYGQ